jgi:hypothetical protein
MKLIKFIFESREDLFLFIRENCIAQYIIDASQRSLIVKDGPYSGSFNATCIELVEEGSQLLAGNEGTW